MQSLEFALTIFSHVWSSVVFPMLSFIPFGLVIHILCQYMLDVCHLLFYFDFTGVQIKYCHESQEDFELLNNVVTLIDYGDF